MKKLLILLVVGVLLAACGGKEEPLPTQVLDATATGSALNLTATVLGLTQVVSPTPFPTFTPLPSETPRFTLTPSDTPPPTPTQQITIVPIPSATQPPTATLTLTPTIAPSFSPTPTITPVVNPDAVAGQRGALLLFSPDPNATTGVTLPYLTALAVDQRTIDDLFFKVRRLEDGAAGWVAARDVLLFRNIAAIPLSTESVSGSSDLIALPGVTAETAGNGLPYLPYAYFNCGDVYWNGDQVSPSMEDFAYEGRYPRFARPVIRVYVHYGPGVNAGDWELPISEALAQLSQAVTLERVYQSDLDVAQPVLSPDGILSDNRFDLVWHIMNPADFDAAAPCENPRSCSWFGYAGAVAGGPMRFAGAVYVPGTLVYKRAALTHAAVHALGLWVHSPDPGDLLYPNTTGEVLSARDIRTLRCLYMAPPYGDAVLP